MRPLSSTSPAGEPVPAGSAMAEWREGWPLVLAAMLGVAAATAPVYTLGAMLKPLTTAFGWTRTEYSAGYAITTVILLLLSSPIGLAIDRFGARRIALPALCLTCLGYAGLGFAGPSILSWQLTMVVLGLGLVGCSPLGWVPAVASRFNRARALAIAFAVTGGGLAGLIVPPLATRLIDLVGTRMTFVSLATGIFLIAFPVAFLFFRDARDVARIARDKAPPGAPKAVSPVLSGPSFRQAIATGRFWRLAFAMLAVIAGAGVVTIHLIPHLTGLGFHATTAAFMLAAMGPSQIAGRLIVGYFLDNMDVRIVTGLSFTLAAFGYFLLGDPGSTVIGVLAIVLIGVAIGAEIDIAAYALTRYFGMRAFGGLYGLMTGLLALSYGSSPIVAAMIHDSTGSYRPMLLGLAILCVLAAMMAATLGRYPEFSADDAPTEPLAGAKDREAPETSLKEA